jgi:diaminopimelate epimerase
MAGRDREFYKMSGSGNDFVVFDARSQSPGELETAAAIRAVCARGTGVGADGVVFIRPSETAAFRMTYYNADGSLGELCGNASLCCTRLAGTLGLGSGQGMTIESDAGTLTSRIADGLPEIDLEVVHEVRAAADVDKSPGEMRIGFALVGVPHLVVRVADVEQADMKVRAPALRRHPTLPSGANVNFVARGSDGWAMRTFERGVEAETLACGTGAVATAILLVVWGEAESPVQLQTRSGKRLTVSLDRAGPDWRPRLRGEGRVVYRGFLSEVV